MLIFLFIPEGEHTIGRLERDLCGVVVTVRIGGYCFSFLMPERYGVMITDHDISEINSGRIRYAVVRSFKMCGPDRVNFDSKNYTWDLVLIPL